MKVLGKDLIEGIKKSKGVVDESSVIEHLRSFKFNPRDNGLLDIAGSDGRITMLAQMPYISNEHSDGSMLEISSDILQDLVKFIDPESYVEFRYSEDSSEVEIRVDNYKLSTMKRTSDVDFIDFDVINETEFDDEIETKELIHVLEALVPLANKNSPDLEHQVIFLDTEKAYLTTGSEVSRIEFKTNKSYYIEERFAKQILVVLKNTDCETVGLKRIDENYEVLLKTDKDTLTFKVSVDEPLDISFVEEFKCDFKFTLDRLQFVNSLQRTSLASDEEEIFLDVDPDTGFITLQVDTYTSNAKDRVPFIDFEGDLGEYFDSVSLLTPRLVNLSRSLRTRNMVLSFDSENYYLKLEDTDNNVLALMSINFM